MSRAFKMAVLIVTVACAAADAAAAQPAQVKMPSDLNTCVLCHTMPELFEGDKQRFFVPVDTLAEDAHFLAEVKCTGCHGGNPYSFDASEAHSANGDESGSAPVGFRPSLNEIQQACDRCHNEQRDALKAGVHRGAGPPDHEGRPTALACQDCHGEIKHRLFSSGHRRSHVFLDNQVRLCGGCHKEDQETYMGSVHGHGLVRSGLLVTAVCADCHGAHAIFPADDDASTLYPSRVASTCAQCHRFIEERLRKSVHGRGNGPGGASEKPAPGGDMRRKASCTDCHYGHNLPNPRSDRFRLGLPDRCGSCHPELSESYRMSLHGALTELGHEPAAKCSDCHGAHDVLPINDPQSPLAAGENRLATCRKCHPGAVENFCNFHPHANYKDAEGYPLLYFVHLGMELLIFSVFAFFGLHSVLWLGRSTIHCRVHGRPRRLEANREAYVRFTPGQRILHATVVVSFLGLAATGLPLKYSNQVWAQTLARMLGGFESTSVWHHIFGVVTIAYFAGHLVWLARRAWQRWRQGTRWTTLLFGPDSPVPNVRDATDLYGMFRWFVGRGGKPCFERWTYWEKFDYWAVFWGVAIIGTSGLMLWFPNLFSRILPGEALNVAKVIHSEEALLATSFIFAVHFFGTHLRPEKFPMDMTILTGLISEEELLEERPELLERMRREGGPDAFRTVVPARGVLRLIALAGFVALAVGVCLLAGILLALFGG
ncbi:MAG: hypothetical protein ACC628_11395 [Pirellulaceae bacterium]